jgi:GMP synthase-like glutamine amidotransferase
MKKETPLRVLIVDNARDLNCWGAKSYVRHCLAQTGITVEVRRAPERDLPHDLSKYDRFILTGSGTPAMEEAPWIEELWALIRKVVDRGQPLLGICYGHQAIARALGERAIVRRAEKPEFGWTRVECESENPLVAGLPRSFYSFSAHYDEVAHLPKGFKNWAHSENCAIQGYQLEGKPVYGIQFHPEKDPEDAETIFREEREKGNGKILLFPKETPKYFNPKVGEKIFSNFLNLGNKE